jgi:hypothetical protein
MAIALTTQSLVDLPNGFGLHITHMGTPPFTITIAKGKPVDEEANGQI